MKKNIIFLTMLCLGSFIFAQNEKQSEISIINQLNSYLSNSYYPGVVEYAAMLEKNYPQSVFIASARLAEGQAYSGMGNYEAAIDSFKNALSCIHYGSEEYAKCCCLTGIAYFNIQEYSNALQFFYRSVSGCVDSQDYESNEYYAKSILYTAKIYFLQKEYIKSIKPAEYVFYNGGHKNHYSYKDYAETVKNLFVALNTIEDFQKTVTLYKCIDFSKFDETTAAILKIHGADAYENTGNYLEAYNIYCDLMDNPNRNISLLALQKAYMAATTGNLKVNPEEVFYKINVGDVKSADFLGEFWVRLGIDYYNKGDFEKCRSCFTSAKELASEDFMLVCDLYEAKMQLDEDKSGDLKKVKNLLSEIEPMVKNSSLPLLADSFYAQKMICCINEQNWKECIQLYPLIQQPDINCLYMYGVALYKTQAYEKLINELQTQTAAIEKDDSFTLLIAGAAAKSGDYKLAEKNYSELIKKNKLDEQGKLEYGKVLVALKNYDAAEQNLSGLKQSEALYFLGLCNYSRQNWEKTESYMNQFINVSDSESKYFVSALFYRAYAYFRQAKYAEAGRQFMQLDLNTKDVKYLLPAYEMGAKAFVISSDFSSAAILAEKMISSAETKKDKQKAVILCADIYSDWEQYEKAIEKLQPYTNDSSEFGLNCLERIARIYEQSGDIEKADKAYNSIYSKYKGTQGAEDAMYRSGALYYSNQNYSEALKRYNKYILNYGNGKYTEEAYYFSADSALKTGDYNKAIMQNRILLSKYPETIYGYGAYTNLLEDFYEIEDYSEALKTAKLMVDKYTQQAVSDGVGTKIIEIERILSGYDRKLSEKISKFEKNGKNSTAEGRKIGSELVNMYFENGFEAEAVELAEELVKIQPEKEAEISYAAGNADFLGEIYYRKGNLESAAKIWLKAGEYYRNCGNSAKSAEVLYLAADCFNTAGLKQDALAVGEILEELYPESIQAKKFMDLIK